MRSTVRTISCTTGLIAAVLAGSALPLPAAVRVCAAESLRVTATGATELEAKKAAIDAWIGKSVRPDIAHPSWHTALDKLSTCKPLGDGRFECAASAKACTIRQVAPDGRPGDRR